MTAALHWPFSGYFGGAGPTADLVSKRPLLMRKDFNALWNGHGLCERSLRCLHNHDLRTPDEVREFGRKQLARDYNVGKVTLDRICRAAGMMCEKPAGPSRRQVLSDAAEMMWRAAHGPLSAHDLETCLKLHMSLADLAAKG